MPACRAARTRARPRSEGPGAPWQKSRAASPAGKRSAVDWASVRASSGVPLVGQDEGYLLQDAARPRGHVFGRIGGHADDIEGGHG